VAKLKLVWKFDFDPAAPKEDVHRYKSNREVSPSNIHGMPVFDANRLYVAGGGDLWWGKNEAWLKCIDTTGAGDVTKSALVWTYPLEKHVMATPAVWRGLAFIADCGRTIHCLDAATGKPLWTHDAGADSWASPLVADNKVYFATRRGQVLVFAAEKEMKLLSQTSLGEPISGTPVAANGVVYFATMKRLFATAAGAQWDVAQPAD
jgi:outer membrane protein assembly factor BamB